MPWIATYNIHGCLGTDGERNAARTLSVINELRCDIIALQEVEGRHQHTGGTDQLQYFQERTGWHTVAGPTIRSGRGDYGSALLTRYSVLKVTRHDLSVRGREPRGALDVELETPQGVLRVIACHLGLAHKERRQQFHKLLEALDSFAGPQVLLGDLNEWNPLSSVRRALTRFGSGPALRTFPARLPLLALDRIVTRPASLMVGLGRFKSPAAIVASDHLPLRAELDLSES